MIDRKIQNYVHACILCQLYTVTMTWAIYYILMELVAIFELGHNTSIKATKDGSRDGRAKKYTNKNSRDNLERYLGLIGLINNR